MYKIYWAPKFAPIFEGQPPQKQALFQPKQGAPFGFQVDVYNSFQTGTVRKPCTGGSVPQAEEQKKKAIGVSKLPMFLKAICWLIETVLF